jgi:hypothetical protein
MQCAECHPASASSGSAADRNLPVEKSCLVCHDGRTAAPVETAALQTLKIPLRTVRFSHKKHVELPRIGATLASAIDRREYLGKGQEIRAALETKNACAACHRGLETAGNADHTNMPRMADCLVCHDRIDPPASCLVCHTGPADKLKPATHVAGFLESHADPLSGLDKSACQTCHGLRFQCQGCH